MAGNTPNEIVEWGRSVFGEPDPMKMFGKLLEEWAEALEYLKPNYGLAADLRNLAELVKEGEEPYRISDVAAFIEELDDTYIVLAQARAAWSGEEPNEIGRVKMLVNRDRKWNVSPGGIGSHE